MAEPVMRRHIFTLPAVFLAVLCAPAAAHLISADTGTISLRDTDAVAMIAVPFAQLPGLAPPGPEGLSPAAQQAIRARLRAGFSMTADGKAAALAEDMILTSDSHDGEPAQAVWVARFDLGPAPAAPRCLEVGMDWVEKGDAASDFHLTVGQDSARQSAEISRANPRARFFCDP